MVAEVVVVDVVVVAGDEMWVQQVVKAPRGQQEGEALYPSKLPVHRAEAVMFAKAPQLLWPGGELELVVRP